MNPLAPVCLLVRADSDPQRPTFLGTCFAFRSRQRFLTAAHCVTSLEPAQVGIFSPDTKTLQRVNAVTSHATSDIAALVAATPLRIGIDPFPDIEGPYKVGADFQAYGFPEDVFGTSPGRPTPRLFKGHFQRYFQFQSHLGYQYVAGEMSIGCPAGLSGGPVFEPWDGVFRVFGVVTENHESSTALDSVEEVDAEGCHQRHTYQKVINYGICAMLHDLQDWLAIHAPAPT